MITPPLLRCESCGAEVPADASFCPHCGGRIKKTPAPGKPRWLIVVALCAVAFFLYLFIAHLPGGDNPVIAGQPVVADPSTPPPAHAAQVAVQARADGDRLTIPLSLVRENKIVEFDYSDGTVTVPLLAFISSEGKLVTAFRMCEPCNSKTFTIDGERLSCGNCETQWSMRNLEGLQGTCQKYPPEPFPSRVEGDQVVMSIARIRDWKIRL